MEEDFVITDYKLKKFQVSLSLELRKEIDCVLERFKDGLQDNC
jgi:hypothetical protein